MAEKTILVCDACGRPATETVTIRVGARNLVKDLCAAHVQEITVGARKPRPGRRKGTAVAKKTTAAPKRRGRPRKKAAARKRAVTRKRAARKKAAA